MKRIVLALLLTLISGHAVAENKLTIEITGGAEGAQPIAVVPFGAAGTRPAEDIASIVAADLARTGRFAPLSRRDMVNTPEREAQVDFREWQVLGANNLVIGRVLPGGADDFRVEFDLFDVFGSKKLLGAGLPSTAAGLRRTAHRIADAIYEKLTGQRGVFATRIAYVTSVGRGSGRERVTLRVADSDGFNPQTIVESFEPLMSPAWSPDGRRLAYVSFENRNPAIYLQELATGRRERVASHTGINGSPAFSPDGGRLALTLSKDGNPDIYVLDLASRQLTRLTDDPAIATEPCWSPDARNLVFTSDRAGQPQIYRVSSGGGAAQRLTFEGSYNASAKYSPDGRSLALVTRVSGQFRIGLVGANGGGLRVLSNGALDESPSFAPNGSMVIYASQYNGRGVLAVTPLAGGAIQRLTQDSGEVREPAWSPPLR